MIITIDGPAASGKSTTAKLLAEMLKFNYLSTGLLYRAVAYLLLRNNRNINDQLMQKDLDFINDIKYEFNGNNPKISFKHEDITSNLYNNLLDQAASIISKNPLVREKLLVIQRNVANSYSIVADGRDCGTVVFPNADYKFYLTANVEVRANRMKQDLARKNLQMDIEEIKKSLIERDKRDMERSIAPLRIPEGGIIIDNSNMNIQDTLKEIENIIYDEACINF